MSEKKEGLNLKKLQSQAMAILQKLQTYSFPVFLVFVGLIYGFVLLRINSLRSVEPSDTAVSSQVQAAQIPHIDESVVNQLESLQDNSVSVQTLFDQARSNPFQ
jgi:hypothetical protein